MLYQEIEKNVSNPDIAKLMRYMARDESRHAGFINKALNKLGVAVDLGVLKAREGVHLFQAEVYLLRHLLVRKDWLRALHHHLPAS